MVVATPLAAQDRPAQPLGQVLPIKPARHLNFHTDRGSWMSLALSPNGRTLAFDMLGDLYTIPVTGGNARQISTGLGFDSQPVFSPDGAWIAFVSDRSGADNLWIMRLDGTGARQVSFNDDDKAFVSPEWSADGKAVFICRYRVSLNSYELWRYTLDGTRTELAPVRPGPPGVFQSTLGPSASRDGRYLYYARQYEAGGERPWRIVRRDLSSDAEIDVVQSSGGRGAERETFFRPQVSPDGRLLAYASRRGGKTWMRVRELATGLDRPLGETLADSAEASSWQDLLPRYAFTPDSKAVILTYAGGIERRPVNGGGTAARVPFSAKLRLAVAPTTRIRIREQGDDTVRAHLALAPIASPDGTRVAFGALGGLHVQALAGGPSRRLPVPGDAAFQPSWSPDGTRLAFVTWSEASGGAIWTMPANGSAPAVRVSDVPAYYSYPVFSPDGSSIVAMRSAAAGRRRTNYEYGKLRAAQLVVMPAAGGAARVVTEGRMGARPHFGTHPHKVHVLTGDGIATVDLASDSVGPAVQVKGPGWYFMEGSAPVDDLRVSPDGKWFAALVAQQLHVVAAPADGVREIDVVETTLPHRQLTRVGADYVEWTPDGMLDIGVGARFERIDPATGAVRRRVELLAKAPRLVPGGSILLRGARLLTMAGGDRVIEDGDVLVTGERIAAVGPRGSFAVPAGTVVREVAGKTILPGFIDTHDHIGSVRRDVLSLEEWGLRSRLAYGVTTAFDPSSLSVDIIAYQDLLDAGLMLGPRLRSTGPAIFSMNRFESLDKVRDVLRRYRDLYGLRNVKEYRTGNRRVRQWVAIAARELGLLPTTEGALSLKLELSQILDGYAGNEHALPASPLGTDVIKLLTAMRTSYTTTLSVANGGSPASTWFKVARDPSQDAKLRRFWPPDAVQQMLASSDWHPFEHQRFPAVAADARAVQRAGGLVGMGAHGDMPGIGFHWEMESHVLGGMTPVEVLHAATAGSAETIGRLDDLGTIQPGKLADLLILDRDPRVDIRHAASIRSVMRGGYLYDAATLDLQWPQARSLPPAWFARGDEEPWLPEKK